MNKQIISLVRERDYVSFTELEREIPGFKGDLAMCYGDYPNVILWPKISREAVEALTELIKAKQLFMLPTIPPFLCLKTRHLQSLALSRPVLRLLSTPERTMSFF